MITLEVKLTEHPIPHGGDLVLITADGRTLPDDIREFLRWQIPHDVYCIGRSYLEYPGPIDHWGDVDCEASYSWAENLEAEPKNGRVLRHTLSDKKQRGFDVSWDIVGDIPWDTSDIMWHGSTALFAVLTCLEMGYEKIIMAGTPLDSKGHWYYPPENLGPRWTGETYQAWFEFAETERAKQVRSMSGYTKTLLGMPSKEWIRSA